MTSYSNKQLGADFEKEMCQIFADNGYWVHFITPDRRGAQPFDIIAVKNGRVLAIECKTLDAERKSFPLSRLEDNQKLAFQKWEDCGNGTPIIAVKHGDKVKCFPFWWLLEKGRVSVEDMWDLCIVI